MESTKADNNATETEKATSSSPRFFTPPIKSELLPVGKKLTKDLVLSKSKGGSLIEIKKIVVWAQKITDCSIVTEIPELEVASMNANKISSLEHFGQCPNLRELFLRNNCIEDLHEIYYLKDLPNLQILWLAGNPCTKNPKYRSTVIRNLEQLQKLDDLEISAEERASSESDGLLFEQPPVRPPTVETVAATDSPPMDLAEQMRPAEDIKLQAPEPSTTTPVTDSTTATVPASGDAECASTEPSKLAPAPIAETSATVPNPSATPASGQSTGSRLGTPAVGVVAPLPRYALAEVRIAVLRLIRLLDQESLQLVMHTVQARLQEGATGCDQPQQQQISSSDTSTSFSLDNL